MRDNLEAAIVHDPIVQKLSIFKPHTPWTHVIRRPWFVVDVPAGIVVARCASWAAALEFADHYIRAALTPGSIA